MRRDFCGNQTRPHPDHPHLSFPSKENRHHWVQLLHRAFGVGGISTMIEMIDKV